MALQLWMPLTKDFSNQGLYQSTPTTSGGSIVNGGKLGKCCLTNSTTYINTNVPFDVWNINLTSVSMCGWFKFNKSLILTVVNSVTLTGSLTYISCNLIGYNSYGGLSIECRTNNLVSSSFSTLTVYGAYRNASTSYTTSSYTITYDTWVHLALIYDLSESSLSLYVNGSLFSSKKIINASYTATPIFRINNNNIHSGNGPAKCLPFYVNDVRLYDHTLSQAEIHELALGLVCHYKMDDEYIEGTTNYGRMNENIYAISSVSSDWIVEKLDIDTMKVTAKVDNPKYSNYGYIINAIGGRVTVPANTACTLSCEVVGFKGSLDRISPCAAGFGNINGYGVYKNRIYRTITHTLDWSYSICIKTSNQSLILAGDYLIIRNTLIEVKDHPTPYTKGDRYIENTTNLLNYSNLHGHGSSWTLQNSTFNGNKIYKNTVTSPNIGNNAGFAITSQITNSNLASANKVTISFYKKLNTVYGKNFSGYIRVIKSDDTTAQISWSYNKSNWPNDSNSIGKWEYITSTVTIPIGCKAISHCYVYADNATGGDCDFSCIQLELKDHATPYVDGTRNSERPIIYDSSGYGNHLTATESSYFYMDHTSPRYGLSVKFNGLCGAIGSNPFGTRSVDELTVSYWCKPNSLSSSYNVIVGNSYPHSGFWMSLRSESKVWYYGGGWYVYNNAVSIDYDTWYHIVLTYKNNTYQFYVNGLAITTSTNGTFKPPTFSDNISIGCPTTVAGNNANNYLLYGSISDVRLYATALSADDIKSLYLLGARIDDKSNLHTFEIEENGYNLLSPYTFPLAFGTNLTYATQTNGKTVIEDNHFKITRNPNITGALNGNTGGTLNWCGIIFRNYDNILGFLQGHHYLACINVKGYSDTTMNDIRIDNYCGWPASSLIPITTTDNIQTYNPVVAGYNSDTWDTVALYFEINSPLYKVMTGESYSTFVKGLSYLSFRDFKFGFTYTTTTSVGTNLELDNLRLYDVTNLDVLTRIKREGITLTISFIEDGDNGIIKNGDLQSNNIYEI